MLNFPQYGWNIYEIQYLLLSKIRKSFLLFSEIFSRRIYQEPQKNLSEISDNKSFPKFIETSFSKFVGSIGVLVFQKQFGKSQHPLVFRGSCLSVMKMISKDNGKVSRIPGNKEIILNFRKHFCYTATDFMQFRTVCKIIDIHEKCLK